MERNRNWQGWVAIALAGMALLVALGGRGGSWGRDQMMGRGGQDVIISAPPAPPQAAEMQGHMAEMQGHMAEMQGRMAQAQGRFSHDGQMPNQFFQGGPMGERMDGPMMRGPMGHGGIFGIFKLISGLTKIVALGLLAWLLLRVFSQRRNAQPAAAAPTTPAGHDPRVE